MGILSGLSSMGLGKFEGADLYAKEEKPIKEDPKPVVAKKPVDEKDFIFEKSYECPVCYKQFKESKVKTGKARLVRQDKDLRPIYAGIDPGKYDVTSCPYCGYSTLDKYYGAIAAPQAKLVKESISKNFRKFSRSTIVSYEEALERYKLTLANCIVKKSKDSEKAYTCLKMAWTVRGYIENYDKASEDYDEKIEELTADEEELIHNALEGFVSARATEPTPIAGMDSVTLDYLLAVLSLKLNRLDDAAKYIMGVLQSRNASTRIKNNAIDLKAEILEKRAAAK
ncbi:MAG: DUF2225 domain-containing protein [Lachnospiraceae bacterium]|nr:DUF2225 domain-containing protein [Lachnospiraceae bacterium]